MQDGGNSTALAMELPVLCEAMWCYGGGCGSHCTSRHRVSEGLNLTAFLGTADSKAHTVHISRVIIAYTLQTKTENINTMSLKLSGCHFVDDNFKCILLNERFYILFQISMKFFPEGPIDNKSSLVQVKVWHQINDKPLLEPMMTRF